MTSPPYEIDRLLRDLAVTPPASGVFDWDLRPAPCCGTTGCSSSSATTGGLRRHHRGVQRARAPRRPAACDRGAQRAIATCGEYEAEYRIVLPDGEIRWISARGRALRRRSQAASRPRCSVPPTTPPRAAKGTPGWWRSWRRCRRLLLPRPAVALHLRQRGGGAAAATQPRSDSPRSGDLGALPGTPWAVDVRDELPRRRCGPAAASPSRPTTRRRWTPGTRCARGRRPDGPVGVLPRHHRAARRPGAGRRRPRAAAALLAEVNRRAGRARWTPRRPWPGSPDWSCPRWPTGASSASSTRRPPAARPRVVGNGDWRRGLRDAELRADPTVRGADAWRAETRLAAARNESPLARAWQSG